MPAALWLHDALVDGGCNPRDPVPGWERRGKPGLNARGLVAHHIGIGGSALEPGLRVVTNGRPGLVNALCNVHLARDGRPRVVAAGVAWHAGRGGYRGLVGNPSVLGIEAEGTTGQRMTIGWHVGYKRTAAAVLAGLDRDAGSACAHHEWRAEKPDPWALLDAPGGMAGFRDRLLSPLPPPEESPAMIARCTAAANVEAWYRLHANRPDGGYGDPGGFTWWQNQLKAAKTPDEVDGLELLFAQVARG